MQHKTVGMWILSVAVGATLVGCGGVDEDQSNNKADTDKKNEQPAPAKKMYDLAKYLFPEQNGTLVYKKYTANKEEGEEVFTDDSYDGKAQYNFTHNGSTLTIRNNSEVSDSVICKLNDKEIEITETNNSKLTYPLNRYIDKGSNYIKKSPLRETNGTNTQLQLTYTCHIDKHLDEMDVEDENYRDILKILCTRQKITQATLDGDTLISKKTTEEEKYASRNHGIIQEVDTTCKYAKFDTNGDWDEKGCKRQTSKLITFVKE